YTVDMMVKVNIHTGGTRPISMNWSEGGNSGLSMQLNPNSIVFNAIAGNPLNCANGTSGPLENTDLTTFRRIRVVVAPSGNGSPHYVTHAIYDLDNGATVYSLCTGNGGPGGAFGDYINIQNDTCGNNGSCPAGNEGSCNTCGCPQ